MRNFISTLITIAFILVSYSTVLSKYQVQSWTTDDGLPQNTVHSIVQTADGYLWLATLDGMVRFDGVRFTVFNKNNTQGIETNRFTRGLIDRSNTLWVGTENGSVTRYRDGRFQDFVVDDSRKPIWNFALNQSGNLIVMTTERILEWNGDSFVPRAAVADETKDSIIRWSKTGEMWYSNEDRLYRFASGKSIVFRLPDTERNSTISRIFEDSSKRIWIGTVNAGLFSLENEKLISHPIESEQPLNDASVEIEDREGNLWAASSQGAIVISKNGEIKRVTDKQGLSENSLTSVFEDKEGNIWIGTYLKGLNRLNHQSITFYSTDDGLASKTIYPIFQDTSNSVWLGGDLTRFAENKFTEIAGKERFLNTVTSIAQDSAGVMWFGYWGGVFKIEDNKISEFTDTLGTKAGYMDIHQDRSGSMWFASNAGLFRIANGHTTRFSTADGMPGDDVKVIHESIDGTLWFGTYSGLAKYSDGKFTSYTTANGLSSNLVRSLYEDADRVLWIGSYDGGLTRLKDGQFTIYRSNDGLFNDGVFQILEDSRDNLWMSCNRGIYRVAKSQLNDFADNKISRIESIPLGKADGLRETECNGGQQPSGIKAADGKLWFPTQGGVAVIDPDEIKINPLAPPVVIESARVDGKEYSLGGEIDIAPDKNNLEITYTGLSFVKPEFVRFKYRLEGLQTDWVDAANRRTAYFSYLPPGSYTFQVTAANADGVWNDSGADLKIIVRPPYYRTWWFLALTIFLVGGASYFVYRQRIGRLKRSRKQQEDFSRKLLASQEQERQRIASELHDSIGQSLLIIKNRAFLALSDLDEPEIVKEQLQELSDSASGAIEECREISYNLRPYQISRFGLTKTLEAIFGRLSEVANIETTIDVADIDEVFPTETETNIYRVVQESVNNILKHSGAATASLTVERGDRLINMVISDNGSGFDSSVVRDGDSRGGFGLVGMAERMRMLGGTCEIRSTAEKGTRISITVPTGEK